MLVSESLNKFIKEWIDPAENRWADREIDKWKKRKTGVNLNEDPEEILHYAEEIEAPDPEDINTKKKVLENIIDYKKGEEITSEEFENLCIWISNCATNSHEAAAMLGFISEKIPTLFQDIKAGSEKYESGIKILRQKFSPGNSEEDTM